jgi:hypothetical protein
MNTFYPKLLNTQQRFGHKNKPPSLYLGLAHRSLSNTKTTMKQFLLLAAALARAGADEYNHRYKAGDKVDLWVNKVSFQRV